MLSVAEAQARIIALGMPVAIEQLPLEQAAGRWLAEPVIAQRTQPEQDLSAMDGYALRFAELNQPLTIIGESAAGRPFEGKIGAGQAVRIFTGAIVPSGADTILIQEEASRDSDMLRLSGEGPPGPGAHIRRRGLDFHESDTLIEAGERLTPARIALAAVAGHGALPVHRKVRVAIAATGDELVAPGAPLAPGQLPESNSVMLSAMLSDLPVELIPLGILPDDLDRIAAAFADTGADILVTSGGASVGDHDLVRPALERIGAAIDFWRVAMRPGKPVMAGKRGGMIVLGLPGNPVSAFVTATLFLRPLIAHLCGASDPLPKTRTLPLGAPLPANGVRADYIRARVEDGMVIPFDRQDSSMLRTLSRTDALIVRPPNVPEARMGDSVQILDIA